MGSPKFIKMLLWLAIIVGGAVYGMKYINSHPHAADMNKLQPGVQAPQGGGGGGQGGGNIVVIP